MSKGKTVDLDEMLNQLKQSFLSELPERCDQIESHILQYSETHNHNDFQEAYRKVHSLKGSGGTYGVGIISTICHQLEDLLSELNEQRQDYDNEKFIDHCLAYVDLARQAAQFALNDSDNFEAIEQQLEKLRNEQTKNELLGIIIESSSTLAQVCTSALKGLPVKIISINDGLLALKRLLEEKFDFVIIGGKSLKGLNGKALVAAIRCSESINKDINIIAIRSSDNSNDFLNEAKPNMVLMKDKSLADQLKQTIRSNML
ncbi:MAG: Hpt domain-containing protein [Gammaproteobacteria bacterium]|nr:Hpt domain-containing protein [Gammaproteobacteria bacterium]